MTDLPSPLVPAEVDLSDFPFMPIDVRRLRDSRLVATSTGDAFMAWMLLVCASWHQRPAGSLPDDDIELAQLAGFGRVVREWQKVRGGALYGWVKCSDGRLYHPHVAEKAVEAWDGKLQHQWRKECDRIRKENHKRAKEKLEELPFPSFVQWKAERNSAVASAGNSKLSDGIPAENPLIGTGTGTGTGTGITYGVDQDPDGSLSGSPDGGMPPLALVRPEPRGKPPKLSSRKTAIPADFAVSERVQRWASEHGHSRLAEHLDAFKRKVAAKGYRYVDWDAAFMEAIREDWARLGGFRGPGQSSNPFAGGV